MALTLRARLLLRGCSLFITALTPNNQVLAHLNPAHSVCACLVHRTARRGSLPGALPSRFAWLVGGLLLHGHLLLAEMAGDAAVADGQEYVGDMRQLALAEAGSSPEDEPHALVSAVGSCS